MSCLHGVNVLGILEQSKQKIDLCREPDGRLSRFSAVPGAFEVPPIEQWHIFPRRKKFFSSVLIFKKELLK